MPALRSETVVDRPGEVVCEARHRVNDETNINSGQVQDEEGERQPEREAQQPALQAGHQAEDERGRSRKQRHVEVGPTEKKGGYTGA